MLFIQGGGRGAHDEWDDKLVGDLGRQLGDGHEIRYPRMPAEDDPSYARWSAAIRHEIAALNDGAVVAGHSVGGTIMIHAIAEHPPEREFAAIVLIAAPFVGEGGWPGAEFRLPPTSGRGCREACRCTSSTDSMTRLCRRRTPTSMRARSRRRGCTGCPDAIIS